MIHQDLTIPARALTVDLVEARKHADEYRAWMVHVGFHAPLLIETMADEIGRLRAEVERLRGLSDAWADIEKENHAEIERLTAELDEARISERSWRSAAVRLGRRPLDEQEAEPSEVTVRKMRDEWPR